MTTTTASYKRKPFVKKLVFKFCAGGLPEQLVCEYTDSSQFALVAAFEFSEEFDLTVEPDRSRAAFTPDWKNADRAYPTGRPFELKAWSTRAGQDMELTALAARVVMPGYLTLLEHQRRVNEWLPAWSLEDDKLMLKWFSSSEIHNPLVPRWIREQAAAHLQRVDVEGYSLRQIAALVLARWERIEAKMAA